MKDRQTDLLDIQTDQTDRLMTDRIMTYKLMAYRLKEDKLIAYIHIHRQAHS